MTICGIDISRGSATCHIMTQFPLSLREYYKQACKLKNNFPTFYSYPKKNQKSVDDFIQFIHEQNVKKVVMEPTGYYSRLWNHILKAEGIEVSFVGHLELKHYRSAEKLPGHTKSDEADAMTLAAYGLDPKNINDPRKFLNVRPEIIGKLKDCILILEHINRSSSPTKNYLKQRLSFEFPEKARTKSKLNNQDVPPLLAWLSNQKELMTKTGKTRLDNDWKKSIAHQYDIEISEFTKFQANQLVNIELMERQIENEIKEILALDELKPYVKVCNELGLGLRVKATLIAQIYPFEKFLLDGCKESRGHEYRHVKYKQASYEDGKKFYKDFGEKKRTRKNYSRDAFKMMIGLGTISERSGDSWIETNSGCNVCRKQLWLHVLTIIETGKSPVNHKWLENYLRKQKISNEQGQLQINGKLIQSRIIGCLGNTLYKLLLREFKDN